MVVVEKVFDDSWLLELEGVSCEGRFETLKHLRTFLFYFEGNETA